jgi:hypothetical protein
MSSGEASTPGGSERTGGESGQREKMKRLTEIAGDGTTEEGAEGVVGVGGRSDDGAIVRIGGAAGGAI